MKRKTLFILLALLLALALIALAGDTQKQITNSSVKSSIAKQVTPSAPITPSSPPAAAPSSAKSGEKIDWYVISSGGTNGNSTNFKLQGTLSETAVGPGTSTNFKLNSGYWQNFTTFVCDCRPGDANNSGTFNALDITYLINFLYKHGAAPKPYALCSGDANSNCSINALDITYLINYLYKHGSAPADCATWVSHCGMPLRN